MNLMPLQSVDDPFRELFNRDHMFKPDNSFYNVTVYMKGGPLVPRWSEKTLFPDSNSTGPVKGINI
jgi:hypothetical protein